jgi:hypothetical protein
LQGGKDQEAADSAFQPIAEWGCREEESNHSEATRVMLHDQDLPMLLWAKACNMIVYVQNRNPHRILEEKTPEEAFMGVRPEIGHLRIFGCPDYIHVPKVKRTKLEPSGRKGVFVGYSKTLKAYRIYIPRQRQIEVSWDVRFEEELAFRRSQETTAKTDGEEQETPKVEESTGPSSTGIQPSDHEEESEELVDPVDPPSDEDTRPR